MGLDVYAPGLAPAQVLTVVSDAVDSLPKPKAGMGFALFGEGSRYTIRQDSGGAAAQVELKALSKKTGAAGPAARIAGHRLRRAIVPVRCVTRRSADHERRSQREPGGMV